MGEDASTIYIIEIKKDEPNVLAVEQITEYMQLYSNLTTKSIVGYIVAPNINESALKDTINITSNIKLKEIDGVLFDKDDFINVSIQLPKYIVDRLNDEAKKESRARSKEVQKIITDHYNYNNEECEE